MKTRHLVMTHGWCSERSFTIGPFELLGVTDSSAEAEELVAAHAAEHGNPIDHRRYSISVLPWPDPESLARDRIGRYVRNDVSLESIMRSQCGEGSIGYAMQIGGYVDGTKLKPYEMYARVGREFAIFDMRDLYAEAKSGARQGVLL